jgi:hypothetical protein
MRLLASRLLLVACALLAVVPATAGAATTPKVTKVAPLNIKIGERLTIQGSGFVPGKNRNTVIFKAKGQRAVFVKAASATKTRLVVKVPAKLAAFLTAKAGEPVATRFQLRVLAKKLSKAYTPAKGSPTIAPATGAAADVPAGSAPAAPAKQPATSVTAVVPATPAATTPATPSTPAPVVTPPAATNCDGDAQPDSTDADDDNDLLPDAVETKIGTTVCDADSDDDQIADGWEYQSAVDLKALSCPAAAGADYPEPCGAALPDPRKQRSYPNPLDGNDAGSDHDGDWMTALEEYRGWSAKVAKDATYRALTGPKGMWYSAGKKASIDSVAGDGCRGMSVPDPFDGDMKRKEFRRADGSYPDLFEVDDVTVKPEYEVYSLDRRDGDGCLDDGERDEDHDFLTNFEEAHNRMSSPEFWEALTSEPKYKETYVGTDWLDPYSDSFGTEGDAVDGLADADSDDFLNIEELYRGPAVRDEKNVYTKTEKGLWVQPFNPCLPDTGSRTCSTILPVGGASVWRPFFPTAPLGPRWPLYKTALYQITEPDVYWVDPDPNDNNTTPPIVTRPAEVWSAPAGVTQTRPAAHPLPRTDW